MAYTKQKFEDYQVLTADNMNFIEDGIEQAHLGLEEKQDTLVSGTNIKTINGVSLLGEGNLVIQGGSGSGGASVMGYASDYVQITQDGVVSVTIPDSLKNYPALMIYHNGLLLMKGLHYTIDGDIITLVGFSTFSGDVFGFVGFGNVTSSDGGEDEPSTDEEVN